MAITQPQGTLDRRFSSEEAKPTPWSAEAMLETAEVFWLSTVQPDGHPHATPLIAVWLDDALYFCTGPAERKAKNVDRNNHCVLTTGCNTFSHELDLVLEGDAVRVRDDAMRQRLADRYAEKYEGWHFTVRNGAFVGDGGEALVYEVKPVTIFGFAKGTTFGQTRWRFAS